MTRGWNQLCPQTGNSCYIWEIWGIHRYPYVFMWKNYDVNIPPLNHRIFKGRPLRFESSIFGCPTMGDFIVPKIEGIGIYNTYCWWFSNPSRKPVEVGSFIPVFTCFFVPGVCLGFLPSTVRARSWLQPLWKIVVKWISFPHGDQDSKGLWNHNPVTLSL